MRVAINPGGKFTLQFNRFEGALCTMRVWKTGGSKSAGIVDLCLNLSDGEIRNLIRWRPKFGGEVLAIHGGLQMCFSSSADYKNIPPKAMGSGNTLKTIPAGLTAAPVRLRKNDFSYRLLQNHTNCVGSASRLSPPVIAHHVLWEGLAY